MNEDKLVSSPPHIVDSGASVMNEECCNHNCNQGRDCPLRKKELTDVEIYDVFEDCVFEGGFSKYDFARAILRKAQEK